MENFIESYLVSIGFKTDTRSFAAAQDVMSKAENAIGWHVSGMARKVLEAQGAIIGSFASVSAAILGTVDKVAMADQSYRLMGQKLLMPMESARKMDMVLRALGVTLEEALWDPESRQRLLMFSADYDRMAAKLGPGFESGMRSVRDFRAEFGRLGMGLEVLGMHFAQDLWTQLAPGKAGQSFHDWITEMQNRIPEFSLTLTGYAIPALKGTWEVAKATGEAVQAGAIAFTNMIGVLSGDQSIEGTEFSFHKLALAIGHVGSGFVALEKYIAKAEFSLSEFATAAALAMSGKWTEAAAELQKAQADFAAINSPAGAKKTPVQAALAGDLAKPAKGKDGLPAVTSESLLAIGKYATPLTGALAGAGTAWLLGSPGGPLGMAVTGGLGAILGKAIQETKGQTDWDKVKPYWGLSVPGLGSILTAVTAEQIKELGLLPSLPPSATPPPALSKDPFATGLPTGTDLWKLLQSGGHALQGVPQSPAVNVMQSGLVDAFAEAVAGHEGFYKKGSIAQRQHNQGALRNWPGVPTVGGYASFPDDAAGLQALKKQIELNISRGLTLQEFFAGRLDPRYWGYANAKGDNPFAYAEEIGKKLRIATDTPLNQLSLPPAQPAAPLFIGPPALPPTAPATATPIKPIAFMQPMAQPFIQPNYIMPDRDWSALANMQQSASIMPQPNVTNSQVRIELGGIQVHVTHPGADAHEIARTIREEVRDRLADQILTDLTQLNPLYG